MRNHLYLSLRLAFLLCLIFSYFPITAQKDAPEEAWMQGLAYRSIGPYRGGRATTVTGIPDQPYTFFMGTTGGGVWKTIDGGTSWKNITDGFITVGSIGAVEVAPSDPNVIYVGTGSASPRGNISTGKGIYKSVDGGISWSFIGLKEAGQIGKIVIHPENPDWVYVAALGNIFAPNTERGVFKSTDGGKNWEKVCFISDKTGAIDMVIDPTNPRILYAGFWRVERKPWTLIDGDEEGGVYKSTDHGETWTKLAGGLPTGVAGRIGLAISPVNPQKLWVIREAKDETQGGIYFSSDAGVSWKRINRDHNLRQRAWYYSRIFADPQDEHTVYVTNTGFYKSVDGGKSFSRIRTPHGDNHCLWVNPHNTDIMIESNDGGANVSFNGGRSWSTQYNQPTSELYRVSVDNQFPYRVYGAQQDNSTITVPSNSPGGISPKQHWYAVGGGESGHIAIDPRNPDVIYAGNYIGRIDRTDRSKGHTRNIVAYPQMHDGVAPRDIKYRFQWNAPIRLSPHDPNTLYHCSQYVHRSTDQGNTWEVISPDLTTNNDAYHDIPGGPVQHDHTGVELYTTVFSFEESPLTAGELWAGTDDGRVHISRNGGESWQEVTPAAMPKEGTVNTLDVSTHQEGRCIMTVYRYRDGDDSPYVFLTNDYGKNWKLLTNGDNGISEDHFVRVVREDPNRKGLLYAGTEFGMYISFNEGESWAPFQLNLPFTPITDMLVYRKDLVIATQGRSFWILDDLSPLHDEKFGGELASAYLFEPREAYRTQMRGFRGGNAAPKSAPRGATVYLYIPENQLSEPVKLLIKEEDGELIRTFSTQADKELMEGKLTLRPGLNRFIWDMKYPKVVLQKGSFMSLANTGGASAPPATYLIELQAGDQQLSCELEIKADPRWEATEADLQEQFRLTREVQSSLEEIHENIGKIRSIKAQTKEMAKRAVKAGYDRSLMIMAEELGVKLTEIEEELIQVKNESSQDPINYPPRLDDQFAYLYSTVNGQDARPTQGCYDRYQDLKAEYKAYQDRIDKIIAEDVQAFDSAMEDAGVPRVIPTGR
ncbi:MAG: glycosyl hydrolase [Bacteroidota bacterium]